MTPVERIRQILADEVSRQATDKLFTLEENSRVAELLDITPDRIKIWGFRGEESEIAQVVIHFADEKRKDKIVIDQTNAFIEFHPQISHAINSETERMMMEIDHNYIFETILPEQAKEMRRVLQQLEATFEPKITTNPYRKEDTLTLAKQTLVTR